jgi:glutamyl-tRNA synthetase
MILGPDGQKLSKRHGAVSVMQYETDGFLPEALFNYLARLGWSHGDAERFSRAELVDWFDLDHVNRAPAQYNLDKLLWLNGEYMKAADDERLAALVAPRIAARGGTLDAPPLPAAVALLKDRARTLEELADEAMLFYGPVPHDAAVLAPHLAGTARAALEAFARAAPDIEWERAAVGALLKRVLAEFGLKMPQLAVPLRLAVTGRTQTPSIDAVLALAGRERVLERIAVALAATA